MDVLFRVRARLGQLPIHMILWVLLLLALLPVSMMLIQGGKTTQQFEANQWGISWPYHLDGYVRMFRGLYKTILNTLFICAVAISVSLGLASYSSYVFARFKFPGREALYYLIIGLMMVPFIVSVVPQYRLMHELGIDSIRRQKAYTLSGGERRRTEIARSLAIEPKFLLLDEPFAGIDPIAVTEIKRIVQSLSENGIGVLLTDHNVRDTLEITHRSYLINLGDIIVSGTREELLESNIAREIYLGQDFEM